MVKRRGGLGRGIDYLLSGSIDSENSSREKHEQEKLSDIPVEYIRRGRYQPRLQMKPEHLDALAESIRSQGILQPVLVRSVDEGYELIAGERRWRAAQLAGLANIPCIIREISDQAMAAMALIENIQREDLNPLEEAEAIARLIAEFSLTHQEAATAIGRSRATVSNLLRLLDLEERVKQRVHAGELEMGHVRCLLPLPAEKQVAAAQLFVQKQMTVREAENWVKRMVSSAAEKKNSSNASVLPEVRQLENRLADTLGAPVQVRYDRSGKGRLIIEYNSLDELDGILSHIR